MPSSIKGYPQKSTFNFTTDYVVYPIREQGIYPIRESDWFRIKRLTKNIIPPLRIFEILASGFVGVTGSALLSIIAFYNTSSVDPSLIMIAWATLICSLVLSIVLFIIDSQQKRIVTTSVENVIQEMDSIEKE
jgi:hypothetical protein